MHSAYARIGRPRTCQTPWLGLGMNAGTITAGIRLDMATRNATRPVQPRPGTPGHDGDSVPCARRPLGEITAHWLSSTSLPKSWARSPMAAFDNHSTFALSVLPNPSTCAPWPTSYPPDGSFFMPSTGTPTAWAICLIWASDPVSPTNDGSKRSRYLRITGPVSRAGSVVMNSICTWSRTDLSNFVSADATSAITVGQTSGQFV